MRKSALLADTLRTAVSPAALGGGGAEDQSAIFFNPERLSAWRNAVSWYDITVSAV